jgi:hypothetical protein
LEAVFCAGLPELNTAGNDGVFNFSIIKLLKTQNIL